MTVEVASLTTTHKVDLRDLKRNFQEAEHLMQAHVGKLNNMLSGVGTGGGRGLLSGVLSVAGGNIVTSMFHSITGALTGAVKAGFDYNKLQEQTALGFKVMLKDGKQALDFMQQLQKFAETSSMDLPGVYTGAQRLLAMGFQAKQVIPILTAAGDAAAGLGKVGGEAAQKVDQITLALGQMLQKGKVSAEEMNQQLIEAGIPAWKYLGDEIARTDAKMAKLTDEQRSAKVQQMATKGMLNARTAVAVIVKGMEEDFKGLGQKISAETASGIESNIGDTTDRLLGQAAAPAFEKYKKLLNATLTALNSDAANKIVGGVSAGTGALFDAMEFTLKAVTSGDIGSLGLGAVTQFVSGVKDNLGQAVNAGASIVQSAIGGGEKEQAHASARWSELGKDAAGKYFSAFHGKVGLQAQEEAGTVGSRPTAIQRNYEKLKSREPAFNGKLNQIAQALGIDPNWLLNVMGIETAGTFRKDINNGQGYEGLIQFNSQFRKRHNLNLSQISATEQLDYVQKYFEEFGAAGKMRSQADVYNVVSGGENLKGGFPLDPNSVAYRRGSKGYAGNYRLWDVDRNGLIQNWELGDVASRVGFGGRGAAMLGGVSMQGGLSPQEQSELTTARQQIAILQSRIEQYRQKYPSMISAQTGDVIGGASLGTQDKIFTDLLIPSGLSGATRQNAVNDALLQRRMEQQVAQLQARIAQLEAKEASSRALSSSPLDAPFDFSKIRISDDQAKDIADLFRRARGEIIETGGALDNLATTVVPRGLQAIQLPALKTEEAFGALPPLVNKVSLSIEQRLEETDSKLVSFSEQYKSIIAGLPEGIGDIFGNAVREWDGTFKGFLNSLKQGIADMLKEIAAQLMKAAITKFLVKLGLSALGGSASGGGGEDSEDSGSGIGDFAVGGMIAPKSGGRLVHIAEGGYAEMVLSTDPKHRQRTSRLMGDFIKRTQTIPRLAMGDWVVPDGGSMTSLSIDRSFAPSYSSSSQVSHQYGPQKAETHHHHYTINWPQSSGGYHPKKAGDDVLRRLVQEIDRVRRR